MPHCSITRLWDSRAKWVRTLFNGGGEGNSLYITNAVLQVHKYALCASEHKLHNRLETSISHAGILTRTESHPDLNLSVREEGWTERRQQKLPNNVRPIAPLLPSTTQC